MKDIHHIKPPIEIPVLPILWEVGVALLIAVMLGMVVLVIRRIWKQRKPKSVSSRNIRMQTLKKLKVLKDQTKEPVLKDGYFALVEIMKEFSGTYWNFPAIKMTSEEISKYEYIPKESAISLNNLFVQCLHPEFSSDSTPLKTFQERIELAVTIVRNSKSTRET